MKRGFAIAELVTLVLAGLMYLWAKSCPADGQLTGLLPMFASLLLMTAAVVILAVFFIVEVLFA